MSVNPSVGNRYRDASSMELFDDSRLRYRRTNPLRPCRGFGDPDGKLTLSLSSLSPSPSSHGVQVVLASPRACLRIPLVRVIVIACKTGHLPSLNSDRHLIDVLLLPSSAGTSKSLVYGLTTWVPVVALRWDLLLIRHTSNGITQRSPSAFWHILTKMIGNPFGQLDRDAGIPESKTPS